MNVLSLFDGMSCGQIALNKANVPYDNYFASEVDKYAIQVAKDNYPSTRHIGDVLRVTADELPQIDLLIGGSPCQSFSTAGNGLGFDGKSKLFWEYVRILNECKPKYFLLENVKMKKEWENIITEALGVSPININSRLVSAQNRPRLYWTNIPNIEQPQDKQIRIKDIIENNVDEKYYLSEKTIAKIARNRFGGGYTTIDSDKTRTLVAGYYKIPGDGTYFNDGNRKRRYTPTECEKLQTVPVNYTKCVSNTQRYKMIGNGWTIDVIAHILKNLNNII